MDYYKNNLRVKLNEDTYNEKLLLEYPEKTKIEIFGLKDSLEFPVELADAEQLKELELWGIGIYEPPKNLEKLTNIRKLSLRSFCDLSKLPLLPHMEELSFVAKNINEDIKAVSQKLPNLKKMKILGYQARDYNKLSDEEKKGFVLGELPSEIGSFQQLEDLTLEVTGITTLPKSFIELKNLHFLSLSRLSMTEFPEILCDMTWLEELVFAQQIDTLPDNFPNMKALKKLDFNHVFNKGTMSAVSSPYEEEIHCNPIPASIGQLPALESLELDCCGVMNLDFLREAKGLKHFSTSYSGLENCDGFSHLTKLESLIIEESEALLCIDGLKGLPLKELNLENCEVLESIDAIHDLHNLEFINISGCDELENLDPLYNHPTLKQIEADDEVVEKWENRKKDSHLASLESVLQDIQSDDLSTFETALVNLQSHVDVSSHGESNPLAGYFGEKDDGEGYEIIHLQSLEEAFANHREKLSSESLIILVDISLRSAGTDNYQITPLAINEIIRRKDEAAQVKVVEIFHKACRYYEYGHRYCESTVLDQLYDVLFPDFETEALILLLDNGHEDMLNNDGGDGADTCYAPAFKRLKNEEQFEKLVKSFFAYFDEYINDSDQVDYFAELTDGILQVLPPKYQILFSKEIKKRNQV
jgi:Leucine-rich repeat (LRR) protein